MTTSHPNGKRKKKKKVRYERIAILVTGAIVVLALVIWGVFSLVKMAAGSGEKPSEASEQISSTVTMTSEEIEAIAKPDFIEQETFDALKAQALSGSDTAWQAEYFLKDIDQYDEDLLEFYLRDSDRFDYAKEWPNRDNYQTPVTSLEEGVATVPALLQWDLRWGYQPYGDWMIYAVGCAPTTFSMVSSYLNQDPTLTPKTIAEWADQSGQYIPGQGTAYSFFTDAASQYGLNVETIDTTQEAVEQAAAEGKVMIFHMLPGKFTTFGHFVVVPGVENGQLKINDPNSIERSSHLWTFEDVLPETATIWAYSKAQ